LGVRFGGWLDFFEECMLEVIAAQELEEDMLSVEASVRDLISANESVSMVGPTFEFRESLMMAEDIVEMVEARFFKEGQVKVPPLS